MDKFQIEKGIPMPAMQGKRIYPFPEMEVGDSFFIPADSVPIENIRANASGYGRAHKVKITVRKVDGGWRVWRIE